MITCELNGKKYSVDFVRGRVLREIGPAMDVYSKIIAYGDKIANGGDDENAAKQSIAEEGFDVVKAMDTMVRWFCMLFGDQFTPDDVYDYYPVDRMVHDIAYALMAVNTQTTSLLSDFPMKAAPGARPAKKKRA